MLPDEPNCTSNKFSVAKGTHPCWLKTSVPSPSVIFTYSLCYKKIGQLITAKISYISCNDNDNDYGNDKDNDNDYHSDYDTDNGNDDNDNDNENDNDNNNDNDNDNIQWS